MDSCRRAIARRGMGTARRSQRDARNGDAATLAARYNAGGEASTLADRAGRDVAWHYGHVIVDEAQELSPMEWRMLVRRCPSRSMTVVGDIAQTSASWGASSWRAVLEPVAPGRWREE